MGPISGKKNRLKGGGEGVANTRKRREVLLLLSRKYFLTMNRGARRTGKSSNLWGEAADNWGKNCFSAGKEIGPKSHDPL